MVALARFALVALALLVAGRALADIADLPLGEIVGTEVSDVEGRTVGRIGDLTFDPATGMVQSIVVGARPYPVDTLLRGSRGVMLGNGFPAASASAGGSASRAQSSAKALLGATFRTADGFAVGEVTDVLVDTFRNRVRAVVLSRPGGASVEWPLEALDLRHLTVRAAPPR